MILLKTLFFVLSALQLSSNEVIKFEDKSHILCVTDDADSIIYLMPPVPQRSKITSVLIENDEIWNDWSFKSSIDVMVPPLLDKRWEDLAITHSDSIYIESAASVSYSVPVGVNLTVTVSNPISDLQRKARDISIGWVHWTTYPTINENATELTKFQLNVTSSNKTYFRIHDYKLRWADTVSEAVTTVPASLKDKSCTLLYVYLCYYCTLQVTVRGVSTRTFSGSQEKAIPVWQSKKYQLELNENFEFFRNTTNGENEGQWAVDIRECPLTVANKTIFEVPLYDDVEQREELTCTIGTILTKQNNIGQNISLRENNEGAFSCKPGIVIQCSDILERGKKYCEQHKICDNTDSNAECFCSWGYQGDMCDKSCSDGEWGLSCQNKCNSCTVCNKQIGDCTNSSPVNFNVAGGLLLLGIIFKFL